MDYNYKKNNHRSKSLKSANTYLSKFLENLELDYDDETIYDVTIKNLLGIKQLCTAISTKIDTIVSRNSKELNEVKYTYLTVANSVGSFKYLNYQAVVETSKKVEAYINQIITASDVQFDYIVAAALPSTILKLIFISSIQSNEYEYISYLRSLDLATFNIQQVLSHIDISQSAMYALVLYGMLWEHKLKPMGKYHSKYYLTPDSMYEFVTSLGVSEEFLDYYIKYKNDNSLVEQVGIR